jgi:hypothetical protein
MTMLVLAPELPEAVYRCDKLGFLETPKNEVLVSRHASLREAMGEANRLSRLDRKHTYMVGMA